MTFAQYSSGCPACPHTGDNRSQNVSKTFSIHTAPGAIRHLGSPHLEGDVVTEGSLFTQPADDPLVHRDDDYQFRASASQLNRAKQSLIPSAVPFHQRPIGRAAFTRGRQHRRPQRSRFANIDWLLVQGLGGSTAVIRE
jgi:hypothetical protein